MNARLSAADRAAYAEPLVRVCQRREEATEWIAIERARLQREGTSGFVAVLLFERTLRVAGLGVPVYVAVRALKVPE